MLHGRENRFWFQKLLQTNKKGKQVALTCTTVIACFVYKDPVKATTIHQWTGINDGRYAPQENKKCHTKLCFLCCNHWTCKEYSGLDKWRVFHVELKNVCNSEWSLFTLKWEIDVWRHSNNFCGDYRQLSPVPYTVCEVNGGHCFRNNFNNLF